jgi:hypothetical protein
MFKAVSSFFLEKILASKIWKYVVSLTPRLKGYPKFPLENYFKLREIVRSDPKSIYCFVGVDNASISVKLQRKMVGVYWSHSGFVYLDADNELSIKHVRWFGLLNWKLLKYLKECDEFALIKLPLNYFEMGTVNKKLEKINRSKVRYSIRDNIHREDQYTRKDSWETQDRFKLYCSEYQYFVCQGMMSDAWAYGKSRFTPDDVYKGGVVVWEFRI